MQTTKPAPASDECNKTIRKGQLITPLALAALANGVSVDDVAAYVQGRESDTVDLAGRK